MRSRSALGALALTSALLVARAPVAAQQRLVIQGSADAEAWHTSGGSRLLSRNEDRAAVLGRLSVWSGLDLGRRFLLVAMVEGEAGAATPDGEAELDVEQLVLSWRPKRVFGLEAGRFAAPLGAFSQRRLSAQNPLIGRPDGYEVVYPWGAQLSGSAGAFDYRLSAIDRPISNTKYVPEGQSRLRWAVGGGVTPTAGIRIGASFTAGSYLSDAVSSNLDANEHWDDFGQRLLVLDGLFTRGYFELRTETAFSSYDVPGRSEAVTGVASFIELKHTLSPRIFAAARLEYNGYAFIRPIAPGNWSAQRTTFYDGELGVGFRFDRSTLVKLSYRRDDWQVEPPLSAILRNGSAIAFQVSRGFDVTSWFSRPR